MKSTIVSSSLFYYVSFLFPTIILSVVNHILKCVHFSSY